MSTQQPQPETPAPKKKSPGLLSKSVTILALIITAALAFISTTQTWVSAEISGQLQDEVQTVTGQELTSVVTAMALVVLAAAVTLSIVRRVGQYLVAVIVALSSLLMVWSVILVMQDPSQGMSPVVSNRTGLVQTVQDPELTVWPWVALIASVLITVIAVLALFSIQHWGVAASKKYDNPQAADVLDEDGEGTLNHLDDDEPLSRVDEIDVWDELSRGEDPT